MFTIRGLEFSGFPGRDYQSGNLQQLHYRERVEWLRRRFEMVFVGPFRALVHLEHEQYVWLCVVSLLCAAVEGLAQFEYGGDGNRQKFIKFVEQYFPAFKQYHFVLYDPHPHDPAPQATTPAEHLHKYFRSGLTHSLVIGWGGLLHREDGAPDYLFEATQGVGGEKALGIAPRELVQDFLTAVGDFFNALEQREPPARKTRLFDARFTRLFLVKAAPPLP